MRVDVNAPAQRTVKLSDYRPPFWLIDATRLEVRLDPKATRVRARLSVRRNPDAPAGPAPFLLDGRGLKLVSGEINGAAPPASAITHTDEGLAVSAEALPDDAFTWTAETEIAPEANDSFDGLFLSRGMYCTQCEAEGFRRITYFPDRPDVMSVYEVLIDAPADLPVLLSNGDLVETGETPEGRRTALWRDPHRKPSYLFALVAGDLRARKAPFVTASGRAVELALWVRPGDEDKTGYALDALARSMRWDEREYGREYDLDLFNVVAVDDFNMGAMENKGLNIFNSKYVLASPATATDRDYALIESVVAHEYFHNWTGNRITCRDWFQLCLKEGLTVFRDQQFSGDERSEPVKRIEDVMRLRAEQFSEDSGPLAHPVRPEEYVEINNFYTATVYEKGAEVIGMLRRLVGPDAYRAALDLYFERHDGEACTIEDFRRCFEDATGRELSQFALWWSQSGTPRLSVSESWDAASGAFTLTIRQSTPPTPGQDEKSPFVIPFALGLLGDDGKDLLAEGTRLVVLDAPETVLRFDGLPSRPTPSLLRGFSAPVRLERDQSNAERLFLLAHDSDPFNRWEAGRSHAMDALIGMLDGAAPDPAFLDAMLAMAEDDALDPAFRALALAIPGEDEVAREVFARGRPADPDAIHVASRALRRAIAAHRPGFFGSLYDAMAVPGPYSPEAGPAGRRALRNAALAYRVALGDAAGFDAAATQFETADNMSERAPALALLAHHGAPQAADAIDAFHRAWRDDPLVLDKWFAVQASIPGAGGAKRVEALTAHADFDARNPNRLRSVIGAFAGTPSAFHEADGAGYRLFADWLIRTDPRNPQLAARLAGAFESWPRYDENRRAAMRAQLERIAAVEGLSKDVGDIVGRVLKA